MIAPADTTQRMSTFKTRAANVPHPRRTRTRSYWGIPVKPNTTYTASFYARAGQGFHGPLTVAIEGNNGTGDVILKLVNVQAAPQLLKIDLQGVQTIAKEVKGEVLSAELAGMNSVAEPTKVAPKPITITNAGTSFTHELPAHSVTVIRLKTRWREVMPRKSGRFILPRRAYLPGS